MHTKEEAREKFIEMTIHSWTFQRMTEEEKERCLTIFDDNIGGSYQQRWEIYNKIYHAFLIGLGYDGFSWRNTTIEPF